MRRATAAGRVAQACASPREFDPVKQLLLIAGGAALLLALFVGLRGRGDDESEAMPTTVTTTTAIETGGATTQVTTTVATTTATTTEPARVRIAVRNGTVPKPRRLKLRQGRRLILIITADVSDHVHLHGYDRFADVSPGKPARFTLRLTIPGIFEIELEDRHLLIAELEVRP
jgi:hypothetical protein